MSYGEKLVQGYEAILRTTHVCSVLHIWIRVCSFSLFTASKEIMIFRVVSIWHFWKKMFNSVFIKKFNHLNFSPGLLPKNLYKYLIKQNVDT